MEPTMEEKLKACIQLCEEGDPEMCAFLGKEFYYGMNVPQDLDRAFRYLTTASEHGDAISQFTLGFMYWSVPLPDQYMKPKVNCEMASPCSEAVVR